MDTRKLTDKDLNEIKGIILERLLESEIGKADWWEDVAKGLPRISESGYALLEAQYIAAAEQLYPGWKVEVKERNGSEITLELTPPPTEYIQIDVDIEK